MKSKSFSESIILGDVQEYNSYNIGLRKVQIEDGIIMHTCNDYLKSLEVIRDASEKAGRPPKIITKVYYKYPNSKERRFRPVLSQLEEIKSRIACQPEEWIIQLCCKCNPTEFVSPIGKEFIEIINNTFSIKKVYFEFYPKYNLDYSLINHINQLYKGLVSFGVLGYQNLERRVFTNYDLEQCKKNSIELGFMGFLGLGKKDKMHGKSYSLAINKGKDYTARVNTAYLIYAMNYGVSNFGISSVSSIENYKSLRDIYHEILDSNCDSYIENLLEHLIVFDYFKFTDFDQYEVRYSDIKPFIKRIAFRVYNTLMHSKLNARMSDGFIS